MSLIMNRYS